MKLFCCAAIFFFLDTQAQKTGIEFKSSSIPVKFAPEFISDGFDNRDMTISPSGDEMYYTIQYARAGGYSAILYSKKTGNTWTKPEVAFFSGRFNDLEPAFSPDGKKLFFTSNRPLNDTGSKAKDYDIWYVEKTGKGWSGPVNLGSTINGPLDEFYPSLAKNGNLYFTRNNKEKRDDIFISTYINGTYASPVAIPEINHENDDFNAYVDPDENFFIFSSYKRSDDMGGGDLYYSLRKDGKWQTPKHFESPINSRQIDYCPFVSANGKYFFFTSRRPSLQFPFNKKMNRSEITQALFSNGNGSDDIYIMSFEELKKLMK